MFSIHFLTAQCCLTIYVDIDFSAAAVVVVFVIVVAVVVVGGGDGVFIGFMIAKATNNNIVFGSVNEYLLTLLLSSYLSYNF